MKKTGKNNPSWKGYEKISGALWSNIRYEAKRRKIHFDITIQEAWELFLNQGGLCELSGEILKFNVGGQSKTSGNASLDRKDSSKGYIKDNCRWTTKIVNRCKNVLSDTEYITLCEKVINYNSRDKNDKSENSY